MLDIPRRCPPSDTSTHGSLLAHTAHHPLVSLPAPHHTVCHRHAPSLSPPAWNVAAIVCHLQLFPSSPPLSPLLCQSEMLRHVTAAALWRSCPPLGQPAGFFMNAAATAALQRPVVHGWQAVAASGRQFHVTTPAGQHLTGTQQQQEHRVAGDPNTMPAGLKAFFPPNFIAGEAATGRLGFEFLPFPRPPSLYSPPFLCAVCRSARWSVRLPYLPWPNLACPA